MIDFRSVTQRNRKTVRSAGVGLKRFGRRVARRADRLATLASVRLSQVMMLALFGVVAHAMLEARHSAEVPSARSDQVYAGSGAISSTDKADAVRQTSKVAAQLKNSSDASAKAFSDNVIQDGDATYRMAGALPESALPRRRPIRGGYSNVSPQESQVGSDAVVAPIRRSRSSLPKVNKPLEIYVDLGPDLTLSRVQHFDVQKRLPTLSVDDIKGGSDAKVAASEEAEQEPDVWSEQEIADARARCTKILTDLDVVVTEVAPIKKGACGTPAPIHLHRMSSPHIQLKPPVLVNCRTARALHEWFKNDVQPLALEKLGAQVKRLVYAAGYSCRNRYGRVDTRLSEHALANAVDIAGFVLTDGRRVLVRDGWGPTERDILAQRKEALEAAAKKKAEKEKKAAQTVDLASYSKKGAAEKASQVDDGERSQSATKAASRANGSGKTKTNDADQDSSGSDKRSLTKQSTDDKAAVEEWQPPKLSKQALFLRAIHAEACQVFGTVLGPEANNAHRDHFHLDMKQRRRRSYCQ